MLCYVSGLLDGDCYKPEVNRSSVEVCSRIDVNGIHKYTKFSKFGFGYRLVKVWNQNGNVGETINQSKTKGTTFSTFQELDLSLDSLTNDTQTAQWREQECRYDCQSAVKQWGGLFPVSDDMSGDIYANKLCAVCHNIESFTPWKMRVSCSEDVVDFDVMGIVQEIKTNIELSSMCIITFYPPYKHIRYQLMNLYAENNLRCAVESRLPKCTKGDSFNVPAMAQNFSKNKIIDHCENGDATIEKHIGRKDLYYNHFCSVCLAQLVSTNIRAELVDDSDDERVIGLLAVNIDLDPKELFQEEFKKKQRLACSANRKVFKYILKSIVNLLI